MNNEVVDIEVKTKVEFVQLNLNVTESGVTLTEMAPKFEPSKNRKVQYQQDGKSFEYEIFKVRDEYDPILSQPAIHWDFSNPPGDLKYIGVSMIVTMMKNGGVGLAANQCGLRYNIFVMGAGEYAEVVVNPEIVELNGEEIDNEGCLSSPGLFLKLKRATSVKLKYFDLAGVAQEKTFDGISARVIQHETDHLKGIKFTSLVSKPVLANAKTKAAAYVRKMKKARANAEKQHKLNMRKKSQITTINLPKPLIDNANVDPASLQPFRIDTPDITLSD